MIVKQYWVLCDGHPGTGDHAPGCVRRAPANGEGTSQKARYIAKRAGWNRLVGKGRWDNRDLSPQCAVDYEAGDDQ